MSAGPPLEIRDAEVSLGGRQVLKPVSLSIAPGETLAVVGLSGAGKSTLARLAAGLVQPDRGSVWVSGEPGSRTLPRLRQMVFQDPQRSLDQALTVAAVVCEGLECAPGSGAPYWRAEPWRRRQAAPWLEQMGLEPAVAGRRVSELSGGQRQRVAIARALAMAPALLVADEALSALDFVTGNRILERLRNWQQGRQAGVLLVSHHLGQAAAFAHRIAVLDAGAIVELGPPERILRAPAHARTQAMVAALPPWPPAERDGGIQ